MTRLAASALALALALPACAQRGGGHASFAAHAAAPHFSSSFRGHAPAPGLRYAGGYPQPFARYTPAAPATRPVFYTRSRGRRGFYPYRGIGVYSYPLVAPGYPGLAIGGVWPFVDSVDSYDALDPDDPNNDTTQAPAAPDSGYPATPYPTPYPAAYPTPYPVPYPAASVPASQYPAEPQYGIYAPAPQPAPPAASPVQNAPGSADAVTLIFKDGRPPEQIRNYLATRTTLTVIDGSRHRDIPVAELDVPATIKANRDTGVGFQLPTATP